MAGAVGNYSDGETIHGGDLNADLTSLLGNDAQLFLDIFAGWNILVSGFALSAGAGMLVNVAAGLAYANGVRLNMGAGSVTPATGGAQPRYDVVWVQAGKTAGTNPTTSNPTQSDSGAYGITTGTAGSSPVIPSLGDPTKVQVGTIYVPASATLASTCTLNSQATAPNAQGPVKTFVDLLTHIAASLLTTPVHGAQATSAGGSQTNSLALTDGTYGAVGSAIALLDGGGTRRTASTPGATGANLYPVMDTNSRVYDSNRLAGHIPGSGNGLDSDTVDGSHASAFDTAGAASGVQGNLNAHTAQSAVTGTVHGIRIEAGNTATAVTDGSGNANIAVTFATAFATAPTVVANLLNQKPGNASVCVVESVTTTGFTLAIGFASNSGSTVQGSYIALGT